MSSYGIQYKPQFKSNGGSWGRVLSAKNIYNGPQQITTHIINGEPKGTYIPTVKPRYVITTQTCLSNITQKDNTNIFQTSLTPTSPQNNTETQDTSHQPQ